MGVMLPKAKNASTCGREALFSTGCQGRGTFGDSGQPQVGTGSREEAPAWAKALRLEPGDIFKNEDETYGGREGTEEECGDRLGGCGGQVGRWWRSL